jgi:hypothetical protein
MIDVVSDKKFYTGHGQYLNSEGKESMEKKIAVAVQCMLNKIVKPISEKWYTDRETDILDCQPVQGKTDNIEEGNNESGST